MTPAAIRTLGGNARSSNRFQQFSAAKVCVLPAASCTSPGQFSVRLDSGSALEFMAPEFGVVVPSGDRRLGCERLLDTR